MHNDFGSPLHNVHNNEQRRTKIFVLLVQQKDRGVGRRQDKQLRGPVNIFSSRSSSSWQQLFLAASWRRQEELE